MKRRGDELGEVQKYDPRQKITDVHGRVKRAAKIGLTRGSRSPGGYPNR
jgi:hypothetical protein